MISRPTRRFRNDALKPQRPQIQLVDEDLYHPHRVVFSDVIVKELGEQNALPSLFALDKALNQNPDSIHRILTPTTFSHSLDPLPTFLIGLGTEGMREEAVFD